MAFSAHVFNLAKQQYLEIFQQSEAERTVIDARSTLSLRIH